MACGPEDGNTFEVFPWNENLETGIKPIDSQHKTLVGLINKLAHHHVKKRPGGPEQVLDELTSYAERHFKDEEEIWKSRLGDHPWYADHLKTHDAFLPGVHALTDGGSKPVEDCADDLVRFLIDWLLRHIVEGDKRLAIAVRALEKGHAIEEAERLSEAAMSGSGTALIDRVLSMYGELSSRALQLAATRAERGRIDAELRQARDDLERTVEQRTAQLTNEIIERERKETALKERNRMIEILQRAAYTANARLVVSA